MWILNPKSSIQCFVSFFRFYLKLIKVKREASRRATQLTFRALEKNNNYNNKNKNCVSFFGGIIRISRHLIYLYQNTQTEANFC